MFGESLAVNVVVLAVSLGMLYFGAGWLVRGAGLLARAMHIRPIVVRHIDEYRMESHLW